MENSVIEAKRTTYNANKIAASSSVTRPSSMGSISGPTSRLGLNGPKKSRSFWSPENRGAESGLGIAYGDCCEGADRSDALARSCKGFSASSTENWSSGLSASGTAGCLNGLVGRPGPGP